MQPVPSEQPVSLDSSFTHQPSKFERLATTFFSELKTGKFGDKTALFPILKEGEDALLSQLNQKGLYDAYATCLVHAGRNLDYESARNIVKFLRENSSLDESEIRMLYARSILKGATETIKRKLLIDPNAAFIAYRQTQAFDSFDIKDILFATLNSNDFVPTYKAALSFYNSETAVIKFMQQVGIYDDIRARVVTDHLLDFQANFDHILKNYLASGIKESEIYSVIEKNYPAVHELMKRCHIDLKDLSTINPILLNRIIHDAPAAIVGSKEIKLSKQFHFILPIAFQNGLEHDPNINWQALFEEQGEALFEALKKYDSNWALETYEYSLPADSASRQNPDCKPDGRIANAFLKGAKLFGFKEMFEYINGENTNIYISLGEIDLIEKVIEKLGGSDEVRHDFFYDIMLPVAHDNKIYIANNSYQQMNGALRKMDRENFGVGQIKDLCSDWEKLKCLLPTKKEKEEKKEKAASPSQINVVNSDVYFRV